MPDKLVKRLEREGKIRKQKVGLVQVEALLKEGVLDLEEAKRISSIAERATYLLAYNGNYVLYTLKAAYREFEQRVGETKSPRGTKTELIESAIRTFPAEFTLADLERACPGVSRDMVRRVLKDLQKSGKMECLGRGPGALWRKKGITSKRR